MDRVLQSVTVAKNRLQLIAACCFLLAAKYEEAEENIPSAADMSAFCNNAYPASLINEFEVLILERLGWKCTVITPLSYLGQFAAEVRVAVVTFQACCNGGGALVCRLWFSRTTPLAAGRLSPKSPGTSSSTQTSSRTCASKTTRSHGTHRLCLLRRL
jgi:Cyclin, N-terminal domain